MKNYSFGNYICELREKKGLSQSQLGEKLGVTNKAVSRWENGSAYPSTELMLPLAKILGVTIEDIYKAISEDKEKKTKLRIILEYLMQHSKIITVICLILILLPYGLFACFAEGEGKESLIIATPIVTLIVYGAIYISFILMRKNPFASNKVTDVYTAFFLIAMTIGYIFVVKDFVVDVRNGFTLALCIMPTAILAIIHTLKRRYK